MEDDEEYLFKIIVLGNSNVGKTNIITQYTEKKFSENSRNTIGVDFKIHQIEKDGVPHIGQFWDTAGQEKFRSLSPAVYKNAHAAIVVYDITNRESFDALDGWISEFDSSIQEDI